MDARLPSSLHRPILVPALAAALAIAAVTSVGCSTSRPARETTSTAATSDAAQRATQRLDEATVVLGAVSGTTENPTIPAGVVKEAQCVAVVPDLFQAGLLVGGKHGRGVVTCKTGATGHEWSEPAFFEISGGTAGAQIGAQSSDLVMVVIGARGKQAFLNRDFRIGGDAAAAAGPVSRGKSQDTTAPSLNAEILTYAHSRGLFAGVQLSGARVKQDEQANRAFHASDDGFTALLAKPAGSDPREAAFLAKVRSVFDPPAAP